MSNDPAAGVHRRGEVDVNSRTFFAKPVLHANAQSPNRLPHDLPRGERPDLVLLRVESARTPCGGEGTLMDGIKAEERLLAPTSQRGLAVIDTSDMSVHDLTRRIRDIVAGRSASCRYRRVFGFKHGLPLDADHVVDVRFLKEPVLGRRAAAPDRKGPRRSPTTCCRSRVRVFRLGCALTYWRPCWRAIWRIEAIRYDRRRLQAVNTRSVWRGHHALSITSG